MTTVANALLVLAAATLTVCGLVLSYKLQQGYTQNSQTPLSRFLGPQVVNLGVSVIGVLVLCYFSQTAAFSPEHSIRVMGSVNTAHPLRVYAALAEELVDTGSSGFDVRIPDVGKSEYKILLVQDDRVVGTAMARADRDQSQKLNFVMQEEKKAEMQDKPKSEGDSTAPKETTPPTKK